MRNISILYRTEMQRYRKFLLTIIGLQLFITFFVSLFVNNTGSPWYRLFDQANLYPISNFVIIGTFLSIPLMMMYSWYREEREHTVYQVLAFPIRPTTILRNKFKAFFIIGMIWLACFHIFTLGYGEILYSCRYPASALSIAILPYFTYTTYLFLILGYTTFLIGLGQVIRRYRFVTCTITTIIAGFLYAWLVSHIPVLIIYLLNVTDIYYLAFENLIVATLLSMCNTVCLPLFAGSAFFYAGLFLFGRYSEV